MILDNPMTLPGYGPSLDSFFIDLTLWDDRSRRDLFDYAYDRDRIEDIVWRDLEEGDDPIAFFEALPDEEAAMRIEDWIERNHMIEDFIDYRRRFTHED